jgi:AraC-like DNA-binding protein
MTIKADWMWQNVTLLCEDEECSVYKMSDKSGDGTMTMYPVFPGVIVMYNDFHMERCYSEFRPKKDMFCVDHCREGRMEWGISGNRYIYVESGDMQIDIRNDHVHEFSFPLAHFHGITIGFITSEAEPFSNILTGYSFDISALKEKFCSAGHPFTVRANARIEHIFSEMYALPDKIRIPYLKVKVLELLLFLDLLEKPQGVDERPYFYKTQVDKTKAIQSLLISDLRCHYTLNELSDKFDFPLTQMKLCFKSVYGDSIYSYIKTYRMNAAALFLKQSENGVADIAGQVGYDNASKFAAAFKSVKGMTPAEYRKAVK